MAPWRNNVHRLASSVRMDDLVCSARYGVSSRSPEPGVENRNDHVAGFDCLTIDNVLRGPAKFGYRVRLPPPRRQLYLLTLSS